MTEAYILIFLILLISYSYTAEVNTGTNIPNKALTV